MNNLWQIVLQACMVTYINMTYTYTLHTLPLVFKLDVDTITTSPKTGKCFRPISCVINSNVELKLTNQLPRFRTFLFIDGTRAFWIIAQRGDDLEDQKVHEVLIPQIT